MYKFIIIFTLIVLLSFVFIDIVLQPTLDNYKICSRDTGLVYYTGTLSQCRDVVKFYELNFGECIIIKYEQDWRDFA